jgi:hypothetical protein
MIGTRLLTLKRCGPGGHGLPIVGKECRELLPFSPMTGKIRTVVTSLSFPGLINVSIHSDVTIFNGIRVIR